MRIRVPFALNIIASILIVIHVAMPATIFLPVLLVFPGLLLHLALHLPVPLLLLVSEVAGVLFIVIVTVSISVDILMLNIVRLTVMSVGLILFPIMFRVRLIVIGEILNKVLTLLRLFFRFL